MVEGIDTIVNALKRAVPDVFIKRRLNFITIHYIYIAGMALISSAVVFAMGGLAYIDCLFFTSGASTQSGLNTVDVNKINTGQQIVLYLLAMFCNPIVIHSSVVFARLYWFEKRFKDLVKEARQMRSMRTRSRSRNTSMSRARSDDVESARREPQSVRGRAIQLLRHTGHKAEARSMQVQQEDFADKEKNIDSSDTSQDQYSDHNESTARRPSSINSLDAIRLPQQMNAEQHIRFLENQRNPMDTTTLRIPSPREFDRGGRVQSLDTSVEELNRETTNNLPTEASPEVNNAPRVTQHITFNEPQFPPHERRAPNTSAFPRVDTAKNSTIDPNSYDEDPAGRGRSRMRRGSGTFPRTNTGTNQAPAPYLSWEPTIARNSFFVNLTEEQREELGGIEYRALKTLALVLIGYFFVFHLLGVVCLTPWIYRVSVGSVVTGDGQGRAWWGIFTAGSAFNDLGFTLTPDSMVSFQTSTFPLLIMIFLIIIGNTGFPCMLRFCIWFLSKCAPVGSGLWEELQFLLDHPRRCFTLLFPRSATWWLFAILVILNGIDLLFFVILDLNETQVTALTGWYRFLVGLFQAASTRTAGFAAVNIADLHPAIQVSYLIMMYISVFPIAISIRRTNVYEEKSLGIYAHTEENDNDENGQPSYVGAHVRKQLGFDLWWIFLGLFIICIVEGQQLQNTNMYAFTIFAVLFEIVSAYGTVGLSLGYPTINASFSAEFHTLSKLVIIAMQIRGRHRGLPYELDRAILLPSESLHRKEAQEEERLLQRRMSTMSGPGGTLMGSRTLTDRGLTSARSHRSSHEAENSADIGNEAQFGPRHRRYTNKSTASSTGTATEKHRSHFRGALGHAMFKAATAGDAIKEEVSMHPHE